MNSPVKEPDTDDPTRRSGFYALRLRDAGSGPAELCGELEHVLSGRRHPFRSAAQLIERLRQEQALAVPMDPTPPPSAALPSPPRRSP